MRLGARFLRVAFSKAIAFSFWARGPSRSGSSSRRQSWHRLDGDSADSHPRGPLNPPGPPGTTVIPCAEQCLALSNGRPTCTGTRAGSSWKRQQKEGPLGWLFLWWGVEAGLPCRHLPDWRRSNCTDTMVNAWLPALPETVGSSLQQERMRPSCSGILYNRLRPLEGDTGICLRTRSHRFLRHHRRCGATRSKCAGATPLCDGAIRAGHAGIAICSEHSRGEGR